MIHPEVGRVRANLERVRDKLARAAARAGRDPAAVEIVAATKYIACEDIPVLAAAGLRVAGENRAQDLVRKATAHGDLVAWDFIGQLQSRRVASILPFVRRIHSLASASAADALSRALESPGGGGAREDLAVLIQVNVAGEAGKAGIAPDELAGLIARVGAPVSGLMTMPPAVAEAERSRTWFRALRELAHEHGLRELSMGTSQDYAVAIEEGATCVRIGSALYL
ncbi:MAG: YggS family pyridoxal phosphate-dependent enzyme [Acidobacteriota bacterium]|nr:YggS family pyridoxal phosphate-dependent enzyme [Acidobacteriota bacterium]